MSKSKKVLIGSAIILVLIFVIIISIYSKRNNTVLVQTSKVERKDVLTSKTSASGQIRAKESANLQSEIAGVITDLPVRQGSIVKKGDVLLKIDPIQTAADATGRRAQYEAAMSEVRSQEILIKNAEANLFRDEASLRASRADLDLADNNYLRAQSSFKRRQNLHEEGLISHDDYEISQNELKSSKSRLENAKAQVVQIETNVHVAKNTIEQNKSTTAATKARAESAAAEFTRASDQLKKTTLLSPLNGVITQLLVEKGERAQPGIMSNPQATLMTISDLSVIQAELKVDETDIVNLNIGNTAQVKIDALPDEVFEGEVTEIGNSPIQSSSSQQESKDFKVIVTLKNPSSKLRPGMSCTGDIITSTKRNVLVIPIQALTIRDVEVDKDGIYHPSDLYKKGKGTVASADSSKPNAKMKELEGVFFIDENMIVRFRPISTGITGESEIEVLENLKEGDEIVSGSFQTLRTIKDGTIIKIDKSAKSLSEKKR
jgi:HlyD family secretion protein